MDDPVAYTIADIIRPNTPFSRSKIYQEIAAGRLKARKLGRRTIIVRAEFESWVANLPTALVVSGSSDLNHSECQTADIVVTAPVEGSRYG